jgi:hypothetical protein
MVKIGFVLSNKLANQKKNYGVAQILKNHVIYRMQ